MRELLVIFLLFLSIKSNAQVIVHDYVFSGMEATTILSDGSTTNFWGFGKYNTGTTEDITLPGPVLRYMVGDSVYIHFWNDGIDEHTIHLHGLDVDQANDGVPFTSSDVPAGDSITYRFLAKDPGVYLYHCHVATVFHIPMGMYGMILIDQPGNLLYDDGPGYNKEYHFLSSDMDKSWNDNPSSPGVFNAYNPDNFLINGLSGDQLFEDTAQIIYANAQDSVLLRLGNIGYTSVTYCFPDELNASIHLSDGRVLPTAMNIDTLKIYPGERYSVLLHPTIYIEDHIDVMVHDLLNDDLLATNNLGFNLNENPSNVSEESINSWSIYPNPFLDEFTLERKESKPISLNLFGMQGQLVKRLRITGSRLQISLKGLKSGTYFLKDEDGKSTIKLFKH